MERMERIGGRRDRTEGENPSVSMYRSDRRGLSGNHPLIKKGRVCMTINLIFKIAAVGFWYRYCVRC